jgi:hypothetical protein
MLRAARRPNASRSGTAASRIATWDGTSWAALGDGVAGAPAPDVRALASVDGGTRPVLIVGGGFDVSPGGDSYLARWGCPPGPSPWSDLGSGLAGGAGVPGLAGVGSLAGGSAGSLGLIGAHPSAPVLLFLSSASTPAAFKGGTLVPVPVPVALTLLLLTDAAGGHQQAFHWPPGIPAAAEVYVRSAIQDAAAVQGVALSNALLATTPWASAARTPARAVRVDRCCDLRSRLLGDDRLQGGRVHVLIRLR